jgi:DNA-binding SARP family transcriptional activator
MTVVRTLDEAIGLVHAVSVERIRAEEDGCPASDEWQVWLCARADAQQARLRSLFEGAADRGIHAVLLGYWPFGLSLTVDDDGRVLSAPSTAEQLTGSYLTTLAREGAAAETPPAAEVDRVGSQAGPVTLQAVYPEKETPSPSQSDSARIEVEHSDRLPQLMILGPEAIKVDGVDLPGVLERRFSWEVATYLACHPEGATADTIIEELWPNEPLMSARKRFTDAVYHLRKALRAASGQPHGKFVLLRMNRYRLDETQLNVDLWEFESAVLASRTATGECERLELLGRVTQLYRGEFSFVGDGLWAESFQHDLRRKVIGALDEVASLLETDNPSMAITMLEDAGRITPSAEESDRRIMRIYQRLGRADDARNVYEALKDRLRRLGEEPGVETRELLRAIIAGSPAS